MGSSPKPPDPYAQASAQQGAENTASITSSIVNNPNRYGPWGSQTYSVGGWNTVYDANGKAMQVPRYNETTTLSPDQMKLAGLQTQAGYNVGNAAVEQSAKLRQLLNSGVSTQGLTPWSSYDKSPQFQTSFNRGGPVASSFGGQGPIATTFGGNNPMQMNIGNTAQQVQGKIGSGGAIGQDQGPTDRRALEAAMMGRFNTDAAKQAASQDAQLAARGMNPGSAQYGGVQEQRDRARADANQQAYLASGAESRAAQDAYNQATMQRLQQNQATGAFANQAQQQMFDQQAQRAGFANAAQMQAFQEAQQRAAFQNQGQQQGYTQAAGRAAFENAAQQQQFGQNQQLADFYNQGTQQNWANNQQQANSMNQLRGAQLQERLGLRNQPLNEIAALLGMGQVQQPNFPGFTGQGVNAAPLGSYIGNSYNAAMQQSAANNSGMFGLGGAALKGLFSFL